jgi:integrase
MRRKRFQKGSIGVRKHGSDKVWVAQWWEEGWKRSKVLGKCSEVPKSQAESQLMLMLRESNARAGFTPAPVYTFANYIEEVFLPVYRRKWKESTRMTTEQRVRQHLVPEFYGELVSGITRETLQGFLEHKAQHLSRSIVDHLRWDLRSIFRMAVSDGILDFNPAEAIFTPPCKPEAERRVLTPDQIRLALDVLQLRERLVFRLAVFEGMRPGEILAIQLGKIDESSLKVDQRLYQGNIDTPKGRKGSRTSRTVALSAGSISDLLEWKARLPLQNPDAWLFPTERGTPIQCKNLWSRHMEPKLAKVGLEWATFQVLRRTNASLSRKARVDDKVAADQRGHGLGVSLGVYAISDLDQKIEAVRRLESQVIQ